MVYGNLSILTKNSNQINIMQESISNPPGMQSARDEICTGGKQPDAKFRTRSGDTTNSLNPYTSATENHLATTDACGTSYFLHDANKNVMQETDANGTLQVTYVGAILIPVL